MELQEQIQPEGNLPVQEPVDQGNVVASPQPQPDDLLSRVTKFVETESPANKSEEQIDEDIYNDTEFRAKIESLEDPELKSYLTQLRKSGVRGVSTKLQEIAEIRKEVQQLREGITPKGWTPERINALLKDPEFLSVAQQIAGQQEEDEYVPESVKNKLKELDEIKAQLGNFQNQQTQAYLDKEDLELSSKYGNYDKEKINELRVGLATNKINVNSEDIYWAFYGKQNAIKAYEMGQRDAQKGISEKQSLSSFDTPISQKPNTEIKIEKDESSKQIWSKIIAKNLASLQRK